MSDVFFARAQMATSLAFHIVFASIGIAMPVLMVLAEWKWRRTGDAAYLSLCKAWAKGTAVLFAVGAVSGTVLSFELGLLFPGFMRLAGPVIGIPFSLEGFAFFTEAIFLGIYLYGWDRVRPALHLGAGVVVALSGLASAAFVLIANAWMNAPRGFTLGSDGNIDTVDIGAAMQTPMALHEIIHMSLAAYAATGFAVAAIHAWSIRRKRGGFHEKALSLALVLAVPCALAQPIVGHFAGQQVAKHQPMKLAALEGLEKTQSHAPVHLGPIVIPGGLSLLAHNRVDAVVQGLEEIPRADWPHPIVRVSFQIMVFIGMILAALSAWVVVRRLLGRAVAGCGWLLRALIFAGPLGFLAIEAGWICTEVGRQPWVIYGVLRTEHAATPMPGLAGPFILFTLVYLGLSWAVVAILRYQVRAAS